MKEKNGKPARPKFHAFLEIEPITDADAYKAMKHQVAAIVVERQGGKEDVCIPGNGKITGPAIYDQGY